MIRGAALPPALLGRGTEKLAQTRGEKKQPPKLEENHPQLHPRLCASESAQAKLVLFGAEGGGFPRERGFVRAPADALGPSGECGGSPRAGLDPTEPHRHPRTKNSAGPPRRGGDPG